MDTATRVPSQPVGVIETTSVEVIRLGDADLSLAQDEGEDFADVAHWRADHERFWNDEVIPTLPAGALTGLTDDTQILVTRFRLATRKVSVDQRLPSQTAAGAGAGPLRQSDVR